MSSGQFRGVHTLSNFLHCGTDPIRAQLKSTCQHTQRVTISTLEAIDWGGEMDVFLGRVIGTDGNFLGKVRITKISVAGSKRFRIRSLG